MPSENKPLNEYGDLHSVHHADIPREEQPAVDEPPRLVVVPAAGNLSMIKWTKGDAPVPKMCAGHWNHKGKAQEAIDGAVARLAIEQNAAAKAADDARIQAEEDAELILRAKEVAAEEERIIEAARKEQEQLEEMEQRADAEAAASRPAKASKKVTTK